MFEAPLSEVEGRDGRLALYASWGSWYSLGQTHERWHVDGKGMRARLCIYLRGLQVGSRSTASPVASWEEPSGGSRSKAKSVVLADSIVTAGAAARWMVLLVVAGFAFRSWSIGEVVTGVEAVERMWVHQVAQLSSGVTCFPLRTVTVRTQRVETATVKVAPEALMWAAEQSEESAVDPRRLLVAPGR